MTNETEGTAHRRFDVFVSYASEDRHQVQSLVDGLEGRSVKVWWDQGEITLGDTLSKKIDEGLKHSRYGVVIISKSSIGKGWPESELGSLLNRSIGGGEKVILPIRLALTHKQLAEKYPLLNDIVTTEFGNIDALVNEILKAIKWTGRPPKWTGRPPSHSGNGEVTPRFNWILTRVPHIALVVGIVLVVGLFLQFFMEPEFRTANPGSSGAESASIEAPTEAADVATTGSLLWRYRTGGLVRSSPAMADGIVYVGSDDGHVYALGSSTGELLWRFPTNGYVWSTPNVVDRVVYVGSNDSHIYALNASTGEVFWEFQTSGELETSAEVADGVVYVASGTHVYALDAGTGSLIWQHDTGRRGMTTPVFVADAIVDEASCVERGQVTGCPLRDGILLGARNQLLALDASSGDLLWSYHTGSNALSTPTVTAGLVYFGSTDGYLYALGADHGELQWRHEVGDAVYSSPAVVDGLVYFGSYDQYLYALDAFTGEQVWRYRTDRAVYASPAVADGVVYIGSFDSYLYAVDALSGGLLWRYLAGREDPGSHAPWSSPRVANGVVYVGADDNHVYALSVAAN